MNSSSSQRESVVPSRNALARIRARQPLVHCIVNEAAMTLTANVLLAAGAHPSLTNNPKEVRSFTNSADALNINLGMLTSSKRRAIAIAVTAASEAKIPWVLDPTMINRSKSRLRFCIELLGWAPRIIRGNAAEIESLCNKLCLSPQELSAAYRSVLVITGRVDRIVSQDRIQEFSLGHEWMNNTTGMGCALSALLTAVLTVYDNAVDAAAETLQIYGSAGQAAAMRSQGPGTFVSHFMDCLYDESVV